MTALRVYDPNYISFEEMTDVKSLCGDFMLNY